MISSAEIQRVAARLGVGPEVIDHDYAMGCFLTHLSALEEIRNGWVFKGGTCLAKCHFENYRFSEDLDFTLRRASTQEEIARLLSLASANTQSSCGLRMDVRPITVEILADDYGKESFEAKVHYEGVWRTRGSPRAIRVHANRDEVLLFPVRSLRIDHSYSDASVLPAGPMPSYALEEIALEKLRAISGQRRYAISRDLYDLWRISSASVKLTDALRGFTEKCRVKGLAPDQTNLERFRNARDEYRENWRNNLDYLVPLDGRCEFEQAWELSESLLALAMGVQSGDS